MLQPHKNTGSTLSSDYRYSFNGMEKDDEVYGAGNSYDFGARIYNPRLGRFSSLDPQFNPHETPYLTSANNPIFYVDKNGEDNIVYLVMLSEGEGPEKLDAYKIAEEANLMFEHMGVATRVVVWTPQTPGETFNRDFIDPTDAVAYIGNTFECNEILTEVGSGHFFTGPEFMMPLDISPEHDVVITVPIELVHDYSSDRMKTNDPEKTAAWGIVHGTSHLTGVAHVGEDNRRNPDYTSETNYNPFNYSLAGPLLTPIIATGHYELTDFMNPELIPNTIKAHQSRFDPDNSYTGEDNYQKNKQSGGSSSKQMETKRKSNNQRREAQKIKSKLGSNRTERRARANSSGRALRRFRKWGGTKAKF